MNTTRRDWLKWIAMGFALVATFHAEYTLAVASGMHAWVALAVPGALDAYVVRTLVRSREVLTAVLAMVAVNVCSHLVTANVLTVGWPSIAAVSAIAPLVLWRVHALGTPGEWRARTMWGTPAVPEHGDCGKDVCLHGPEHACPVVKLSIPDTEEHGTEGTCSACSDFLACTEHTVTCDWCGYGDLHPRLLEKHKEITCVKRWEHRAPKCEHGTPERIRCARCTVTVEEHADQAIAMTAPDYVPDEWEGTLDNVLPLPAGYERKERAPVRPFSESLAKARELFPTGVPTVRGIKAQVGTGTRTAQRICEELTKERGSTP